MSIITKQSYDCKLKSVSSIFESCNNETRQIIIPLDYQRGYCWGEDNISKLCIEFNEMGEDDSLLLGDIAYYVNNLDGCKSFEIIDG